MGFNNTYRTLALSYTKSLFINGKVGTDDSLFQITDTDLGSEVTSTTNAVTNTDINKGISTKYVLLEGQGNGDTIKEFGIYNDSDDIMVREVIPNVIKSNDIQLSIEPVFMQDINNE